MKKHLFWLLTLLVTSLTLVSCSKDDETTPASGIGSAADILKSECTDVLVNGNKYVSSIIGNMYYESFFSTLAVQLYDIKGNDIRNFYSLALGFKCNISNREIGYNLNNQIMTINVTYLDNNDNTEYYLNNKYIDGDVIITKIDGKHITIKFDNFKVECSNYQSGEKKTITISGDVVCMETSEAMNMYQ